MALEPRTFSNFENAFAVSFAEEISGEAFFSTLAEWASVSKHSAFWNKLALVECETAAALRPLVEELGLLPTDEMSLRQAGQEEAMQKVSWPWIKSLQVMARDYPTFVTEFEEMTRVAPPILRAACQLLVDHEIAIIEMVQLALDGRAEPHVPLDTYICRLRNWRAP